MNNCPSRIKTQPPDKSRTGSRQPLIPNPAEVVSCATSIRRNQSRQEIGRTSMCERPQLAFPQGLGDLGHKSVTRPRELCHAVRSRVTRSQGGLYHTGIAHQQIDLLSFASSRLGDFALETSPRHRGFRHHLAIRSSRQTLCQATAETSSLVFQLKICILQFAICNVPPPDPSLSPQPLPLSLSELTSPHPRVRLVLSHGTLRSPV